MELIERRIPVGLWIWDVARDLVFADEFLSAYFGLPQGDGARGVKIDGYLRGVHYEDVERVRKAVQVAVNAKSRFSETYRVLHRNGQMKTVGAVGHCFSADGGTLLFPGWIVDLDENTENVTSDEDAVLSLMMKAQEHSTDPATTYLIGAAITEFRRFRRRQ